MHPFHSGVRQAIRHPAHTLVCMATLGLGIGLVTTQFSLVEGVLLRRLPFPESQRLLHIAHQSAAERSDQWHALPLRDFEAYRERQEGFEDLAAFTELGVTLSRHGGPAERHLGAAVTANFFALLRTPPALGRTFAPGEDRPGSDARVILSHALWQASFGGSPEVLGRVIQVNSQPATIIGVMPAGFRFPTRQALWINLREAAGDPREEGASRVELIGRLKPGLSTATAAANLHLIARQLAEAYPDNPKSTDRVHVDHFASAYAGVGARTILMTMLAMTALVLVLGCVNVTNLLLARGAGRWRELAVRTALGARRGQLVAQLLLETVVLAGTGAVAGLALAALGVSLLNDQVLRHLEAPYFIRFELNPLVLAVTAATTLVAGIAAGVIPALRGSSATLVEGLTHGERTGASPKGSRFSRALVGAQIALGCGLVVLATMMVAHILSARGFLPVTDPDSVLVASLDLPNDETSTKAARVRFCADLVERAQQIPGVTLAAVSSRNVVGEGTYTRFEKEGETYPDPDARPGARIEVVSHDYFRVLGTSTLQGRSFDRSLDRADTTPVALVNASFARKHWPGRTALGQRLRPDVAGAPWATVIGVVADLPMQGMGNNDPAAGFYLLQAQQGWARMHVVLRTRSDPAGVISSVRAVVTDLDPDQAVTHPGTLRFHAARQMRVLTIVGTMAAVFGSGAMVLAAVGIYGVMALSVARRRRELGIRAALGAPAGRLWRSVLAPGLRQLGMGLTVGLALAYVISRPLAPLLSEGTASDGRIYAGVALAIALTALASLWLPARRAVRVDPVIALRSE